jgi:hypothetical protein
VEFVVEKWHWDKLYPSTLVSLANYNSTDCSTIIIIIYEYHPELVQ